MIVFGMLLLVGEALQDVILNYIIKTVVCQTDLWNFAPQKVFHTQSHNVCKTVENSVDYEENLHIPAKIRHYSCIYAKKPVENFLMESPSGKSFFSFFL